MINKSKYWYRKDVEYCVLCGKETYTRTRVYNEKDKGTFFKENACHSHF